MALDSSSALRRITLEMIEDFRKENTMYLEIRTTLKNLRNYETQEITVTKAKYLETVLEAINSAEKEQSQISTRVLVSVDRWRGLQEAKENLELMKEYLKQDLGKKYIVGIQFSGNPKMKHFNDYKEIFEEARKLGFKISVHAAEKQDQHQQLDDILAFKPDRLGHTTNATSEQLKTIAQLKIPVEVCPTSNLGNFDATGYGDLKHFKILKEEGGTIIICTDDTGLFRVTHTDQMEAIAEGFNLTGEELAQMQLKAIDAIFDQNEELKEKMRARVTKFLDELQSQA